MFRLIESQIPTLILDEAEMLVGKGERAEAIRALLNAGNRTGAKVARCVGQSHNLQFFSVYCPKVICAIRVFPETVRDRSIVIPMQRKRPEESVARFSLRRIRPEGDQLRGQIKTFAAMNREAIADAYERCAVEFLTDRDAENWEPLVAICTVTDPSRLRELRAAAESLTREKRGVGEDESLSLRLLVDLRDVWPEGQANAFTSDLLDRLAKVEDAPWREELPLNPRKLARMLRPFDVTPDDVRLGNDKAKGYRLSDLRPAFDRYLTPKGRQGDKCDEAVGSSPWEE